MVKKAAEEKQFHQELIKELVTLSSSGFGLVAALAWNQAIQTFVTDYIKKYYPNQSSILAQVIYAVIITALAVLITYQLSKLASKWGVKK